MDEQRRPFGEAVPITDAIRDAQEGFRHLLRSEIHLAVIEMKTGVFGVTHRSKFLLVFGVLAAWGILPFTAFLVIGLGELLGKNYWLSSLLLGGLALAVGGGGAVFQLRKIKDEDISLRRTRRSIEKLRGEKLRRVA
jgi:hypothetical protein